MNLLTNQLIELITKYKIDTVITCKNRYEHLIACIKNKLYCRVFVPEENIVNLCHHKINLYNYLHTNNLPHPNIDPVKQGLYYLKSNFETRNEFFTEGSIVTEVLDYPEINISFIIINRKIKFIRMYAMHAPYKLQKERKIISIPELEEITQKFVYTLQKDFSDIEGIYNIDYMFSNNIKSYVINDINPGRFPAGIEILGKDFVSSCISIH